MSTISHNKKRAKEILKRVLVWFLIIAMLAGTFYMALVFILNDKVNEKTEVTDTVGIQNVLYEAENGEEDLLVRIALEYGSDVQTGFRTSARNGYIIGFENTSSNVFTELTRCEATVLHGVASVNVKKDSSTGNYVPSDENGAQVGCYHLVFSDETTCNEELLSALVAENDGIYKFEYYADGKICPAICSFTSESKANDFKSALIDKYTPSPVTTEEETTVPEQTSAPETQGDETSGTETEEATETEAPESVTEPLPPPEPEPTPMLDMVNAAVVYKPEMSDTVIIDDGGKVVYLYRDTTGKTSVALRADKSKEDAYIVGYKSSGTRYYDGVLEFQSIYGDGYHGVRVIDVLGLERYVMGVVPYEISSSWPLETQKAFAIAARSYAISHLGRHSSSYCADLCCTTNCQVYKGFGSTTARVEQAVNETKGVVAVCKGKITESYYSSSTGGCTANVSDVWGSSLSTYPYLKAVATPWEDVKGHNRATWKTEYTPASLYSRLKSKGYTSLKTDIKSLEITLGDNTSYVKSIKVTDKKGNSVTISGCSKIVTAFGLDSANFVVGLAGSTVERRVLTMTGFNAKNTVPTEGVDILTDPRAINLTGRQKINVLTGSGAKSFYDSLNENVITATGLKNFNLSIALDSAYYPTVIGTGGQMLPDVLNIKSGVETTSVTLTGTSGSFVFDGLGWGHGVGMSQFGAYDMGVMGYDYKTIFKAYYTGTELVDYRTLK